MKSPWPVFPVFSPTSPQADAIYGLFMLVLCVCAVVFLTVVFLVAVGLVRYRHKPGAPDPKPSFGHRAIEIVWTAIPLLIVSGLTVLTARGMDQSDPLGGQDPNPDLIVIGHQWWWDVRYIGSGVITANEIHIPVGQKWTLRLEAADVIHDFWVPALEPKMDMVPGHPNWLSLEADKPGTYAGSCAEYCGAQHANMLLNVVAQEPGEFQAWLKRQAMPEAAPQGPESLEGQQLFNSMTCLNCHALSGTPAQGREGPDLTHLEDRPTLAAGLLSNNSAHLVFWLEDPQAVKPACLMPDLKLTHRQAFALAAYLEEKP